MTISETDVCNLALDLLKQSPMTVYTSDDTDEARWFVRNYAIARDAELEEHPWKFALKRASIDVDATAPTFDWSYRYAKPADYKQIVRLNNYGYFDSTPLPFEIEGAWILTNESTPIKLLYVYAATDVTLFPALFIEALAAKMALKLAHWLTGKASMVQLADQAYVTAIDRAKRANALQATPQRPYASDVVAARYA